MPPGLQQSNPSPFGEVPLRTDHADMNSFGAGPMRLSLAEMLGGAEGPTTPTSNTPMTGVGCDNARVRNDGTIALAAALADEWPCLGYPSSAAVEATCHPAFASQVISLLDATGPPGLQTPCNLDVPSMTMGMGIHCPWTQRLFLAEHLIGDESQDPGNVKEDFLATPLPFVGAVM